MRTVSASLLVGALVAQEAAATWNLHAKSYSSPNNSDNQCGDKQKSGFNWDSLSTGKSFTSYGGFDFSGFSCSSKFGKRDDLTRRTFQSKCITGSISKGSSSSGPSFSCSDRGFSIDEFQVSVSIDTEVEFHYTMEDNSVCKQTKSCSKSGTTVKNTQCGGAKSVTFQIPDHSSESSCDFGIHSIGFNCNSGYTSTKAISSATPTPSQYSPSSEAVYPTPSSEAEYSTYSSEAAYSSSSEAVYSSSEAAYSSSSEVAYSTPNAVYSTGTPTPTPTPESTTEQPTPYETTPVESWSYYSESSAVYSESSPAESTPVYSTAVESSTLTEATGVYSTPVESTPVYPTSESTPTAYSSAIESYPVKSYPVESYSAESTAVYSTAVYSSPVYSAPVESTAVYSSQVESSTLTEATGVYSTPVYSSPAESSSACDAAPTSSLPDVLPRCFNTWLSSSCKDNADYSCYCKDTDFAQQIYDCVSAWESDSALISQALSYFVGLCAQYVPENPGLVSNCPSSVTLGPSYSAPTSKCTESAPVYSSAVITPAPSSPAVYTPYPVESTAVYVSSSVYLTTITLSQTVTVPCTVPTGVSAGFTIPSSSTLSTYTTTVTVPQVAFTTKTVTLSGTTSETINVIPGTPAPVSATATSLNGYGTTSIASFGTVTLPKTATATLPAFTGAAGKSAAPYTGAAFAAVMALFVL